MTGKEKTSLGEQSDRFKDAARQVGADESDGALDRAVEALKLQRDSNAKVNETK